MKRPIILLLVGMLILGGCESGNQQSSSRTTPAPTPAMTREAMVEAMLAQTNDMQQKFHAGNINEFIDYMPPDFLLLARGKAAVMAQMEPSLKAAAQAIESTTFGEVSEIVKEQDRLVAYIPVRIVLDLPDGQYLQKSFFVAASVNDGRNWKFLSSQGKPDQIELYKNMYPNITSKVPFPETGREKIGL